ncbi:hypothetical protein CBS115989_7508 [Aspergillus niger]|nr:hypothetical protein CBS115989_7508 [Aspergillus niger]KAI2840717.1 hypothetical protein CBS11232_9010 [Aspergillus niger]KAI2870569.1 hypothetical protein CBS115988_9267 [Aspergillus niger]KAI2881007.1 hypothetical protein CBS11852_9878 [Aspergillus niger]
MGIKEGQNSQQILHVSHIAPSLVRPTEGVKEARQRLGHEHVVPPKKREVQLRDGLIAARSDLIVPHHRILQPSTHGPYFRDLFRPQIPEYPINLDSGLGRVDKVPSQARQMPSPST